MVTELKERQEKQVMPASREETINRLDVIEQRISEMQSKSGITENMVQEILNQIGSIGKGSEDNDLPVAGVDGMLDLLLNQFK